MIKAKKKLKAIDPNRMVELVRAIKEREQVKKELENEIKGYQQEIKDTMTAHGLVEMLVDVFTVRYKPVVSSRFDTTKFKGENTALYERYCTESESMKFTIT